MSRQPFDRRAGERRSADRMDRRAAEIRDRREAERRRGAGRRDLDTLLDITRRLMTVTDLDALLRLIADATVTMVGAERATIYIVDQAKQEFWSRVATGTGVGEIRFPIGVGIAGTVAKTGETISIPDAYADPRFSPESDKRTGFHTRNLLTLAMTGHDGAVIGVFQAVNKKVGEFTVEDEITLGSLASSAAVAVENAQLVTAQKRLWLSLIETLATTVDARDQQTAGHSKRVTRYAAVIGAEMGLSDEALERLTAAALLHDYGKIAVRDRFLQKPGKLDDAEFAYMKAHAEKTAEFLGYLDFPPDMLEVPQIAAQHHERMDGKGYPKGLAGAQILVGARIVAAADVFDALTAPRYYKPAYALAKTLEIMDGMAGEHLDPAVMAAVHRALPALERTIDELKATWPKAGDEGMGSIAEAASGGLSERDQTAGAAS
ncbi:MAG TPA: HD domain-containing phosphohydrolase [Candidatus Limnocylindria bacterium]|nr:HD domain-containing phosphohydrolase [Candidatus Limnocylindria bacterium]